MASLDECILKYHHGGELVKEGEIKYMNGSVTEFGVDPDRICYWDVLGDVQELGYDIKKSVEIYYVDDCGSCKIICDDGAITGMVDHLVRHRALDIYVQCLDAMHDMTLLETLLSDSEDLELEGRQSSRDIVELDAMEEINGDDDDRTDRPKESEVQPARANIEEIVGDDYERTDKPIEREAPPVRDNLGLDETPANAVRDSVNQDNTSDESSDSDKDDEEMWADITFINHNSDSDIEREEVRDKMKKFVQLRRGISQDADEGHANSPGETDANVPGETGANAPGHGQTDAQRYKSSIETGKVLGYESEYIDSSDPGSCDDTSDGSTADDAQRHKSSRKNYDHTSQLNDFCLDLRFDDLKMFKKDLVHFSIRKGFQFMYVKNDALRVRARCSGKGCKWVILCSWCSGREKFVVKNYQPEHSCLLGTTKNERVSSQVIADRFGDVICSVPSMKSTQLKAMVRKELGVFITEKVCRNARALVNRKIEQQFKDDFKVLNNYAMELKATNPSSSVFTLAESQAPCEIPMFKRMYICLSTIREGFRTGCRRIVGIDGCFLKGSVKGQILTAVGRDGNNQMYPIAWAVVEKETSETWLWFIDLLSADLLMGDGLGWALISDMQKGLQHAVNELLPHIEHRMCARHIYARWGKLHPGKDLHIQFWNVARSASQPEMEKQLDKMRQLKGGVQAVEVLLERWPVSGWCLACFNDIVECDVIDNNMCETFNGVIVESRSKPIIAMLEDIRQYVMTRIVVKKENAMKWKHACGPNVVARIEKERKRSLKWHVVWNGGASHEVFHDDLVQHVRVGHVVNLGRHGCSCGRWEKSGIPCEHAIAAIQFSGEDPLNYVSEWLTKEKYMRAYSFPVKPVKGRDYWPISDEGSMLPPVVKKMPGRPVKKRRREALEGKNNKLSRHGRIFKCSICHQEGHNKLRCQVKRNNAPNTNPQDEAGPALDHANVGSSSQRQKKGGRTKKRNNVKAPNTNQQEGITLDNVNVVSSTEGSLKVIKGACTDGIILGREAPHDTAFITAAELNQWKRTRLAAQHKKNRARREKTSGADVEKTTSQACNDFPTQASATNEGRN